MQKLTVESKDTFYLQLEKEMFISFHSSEGKSIAFIVSKFISDQVVIDSVNEASSYLDCETSEMVTKCVGPESICKSHEAVLKGIKFQEVKVVAREGQFEIVYKPSEGLIRLTKASRDVAVLSTKETNPVSKNEPIVVKKVSNPISKDVRVLIVDDSKTIRNLLSKIFGKEDNITVVATAEKPSDVEALIIEHRPDVITLDIHMPEMNGVELLRIIQPKYNIPSIMVTSISMEEGPLVLEALEIGAFDYIQKPSMSEISIVAPLLIKKVRVAAATNTTMKRVRSISQAKKATGCDTDSMVVIGSSTGGTNALRDILTKMPREIPPVLIVQHIPAVFSKAFADRLNGLCPFTVKEAENGEEVLKNSVYIAPGGTQMKVVKKGIKLEICITDDPPLNRFKPSVDYLFNSIEPLLPTTNIVSVILTGMGKDGAKGMLKLQDSGAKTIAQDEESSVVFGMPKEAIRLKAAMAIEHKDDIAAKISEFTHSLQTSKHNVG